MPADDNLTPQTLRATGATARAALQALLDQLPLVSDDAGGGEERVTVVRAAAATIDTLIPRLLGALRAAEDDLDLAATALTLDGLMQTDEGWRAWGTLTGHESTGVSLAPRWTPGPATVTHEHGAVTIRLALRREQNDG